MGRTLVNIVAEWQDGSDRGRHDYQYTMPGVLDAAEAEALLRESVEEFFDRAGESLVREAWSDSSGDLNWGDVLAQGYATDYFADSGIEGVVAGEPIVADAFATVMLRHDERLFPEAWEEKMAALDETGGE